MVRNSGAPTSVLVPFTPYEWKYVRQLFRSKRISDVKECVIILATWISRTGENTPVAISCSHVLLQAIYAELLLEGMCESERYMAIDDLRSKHGFAIVRFVNYVNEMGQTTNTLKNMVNACKEFGIPKNIVDWRHALTHQHCPDIGELRYATDFCLEWLWKNFWLSDAKVAMNSEKAHTAADPRENEFDGIPHQGKDHQYIGSLKAFNSWRHKNRQLTEIECTSSEELMALKRHLLTDANGFLSCFLRDGHLIQTAAQLKQAKLKTSGDSSYTIAESTQSFWEPLFHTIFTLKLGADMVVAFLFRLKEPQLAIDSKNQLKAYVRMILGQFDDVDMFSDQEWSKVLDHLLPVADCFDTKLIDLVMSHCNTLTRKRRRQIYRFLKISSGIPSNSTSSEISNTSSDDVEVLTTSGEGVIHTANDLQNLLKNRIKKMEKMEEKEEKKEEKSKNGIELCDAEDWANVPFGMTPGQRVETFTVVIENTNSRRKRKAFDAAITLDDSEDKMDNFDEIIEF